VAWEEQFHLRAREVNIATGAVFRDTILTETACSLSTHVPTLAASTIRGSIILFWSLIMTQKVDCFVEGIRVSFLVVSKIVIMEMRLEVSKSVASRSSQKYGCDGKESFPSCVCLCHTHMLSCKGVA